MFTVRPAAPADADAWLRLRCELWPDGSAAEHRAEIGRFFAGDFPRQPWAVLVAADGAERILGLAELSLRLYAEGCDTSPVAYLEGWIVDGAGRGRGVGRALVAAAAEWGRAQGCTELASDASPDNDVSIAAHGAVGFDDAGLVRCFKMRL